MYVEKTLSEAHHNYLPHNYTTLLPLCQQAKPDKAKINYHCINVGISKLRLELPVNKYTT